MLTVVQIRELKPLSIRTRLPMSITSIRSCSLPARCSCRFGHRSYGIEPVEEKRKHRPKAELAAQTAFGLIAEEYIRRWSAKVARLSRKMFGRLKDWRRIHTRYDCCAHTSFSATAIATSIIFWL